MTATSPEGVVYKGDVVCLNTSNGSALLFVDVTEGPAQNIHLLVHDNRLGNSAVGQPDTLALAIDGPPTCSGGRALLMNVVRGDYQVR